MVFTSFWLGLDIDADFSDCSQPSDGANNKGTSQASKRIQEKLLVVFVIMTCFGKKKECQNDPVTIFVSLANPWQLKNIVYILQLVIMEYGQLAQPLQIYLIVQLNPISRRQKETMLKKKMSDGIYYGSSMTWILVGIGSLLSLAMLLNVSITY